MGCRRGVRRVSKGPFGTARPCADHRRPARPPGDRRTPPPVFYFDLTLLDRYWGDQPSYHHTAPISTAYAFREALRLALEEGLETRYARHRGNAERLWQGLEALDLPLLVPEPHRLTTLSTPRLSGTWDEASLRRQLLERYGIEIAGGFGPLAGKVWRIGRMGYSSRRENVLTLLAALEELLGSQRTG